MKILIDMCLPPAWASVLNSAGHEAKHWSDVGARNAQDIEILEWARQREYIIFTHDLDFGTLLALTKAVGPSVIQVRTQDVTPEHLSSSVIHALATYKENLLSGALMVIDETKQRITLLPLT